MVTCSKAGAEPSAPLDALPGVWRASKGLEKIGCENISTGFKELDEVLPGGGWPLGSLTEILSRRTGAGELTLLMPALARLSDQDRWATWIAPPHIPYAPALAAAGLRLSRMLVARPRRRRDILWSAEQALRSGGRPTVLAWIDSCDERSLRRLQLAAAESGGWVVLFRPQRQARRFSPAALRLVLETTPQGERFVSLLKCRGGRPVEGLRID